MAHQEAVSVSSSSDSVAPPQPRPYSALDYRSLTSSTTGNNFYFAYGSNLSPSQMAGRCHIAPNKASSIPVAIARLDGWKWLICQRGYANVVELPKTTFKTKSDGGSQLIASPTQGSVWGVIYDLDPADESLLDGYEGASANYEEYPEPNREKQDQQIRPHIQGDRLYNKLYLQVKVEKWLRDPAEYGVGPPPSSATPVSDSDRDCGEMIVLVYVDERRTKDGRIQDSYIGRMNRAINESVPLGVPQAWVDEVMRRWIPEGVEVEQQGWVGEVPGHESTWAISVDEGTVVTGWGEGKGGTEKENRPIW